MIDWLLGQIEPQDKVLEIGPGFVPFPRADQFIDAKDNLPNIPKDKLISIDLNQEKLPFADKQFDFIYCRHVVEDMYNPFLLLSEMSRVGKAGYIEMPSPSAELGRGVDGSSPPFRGYHHHHYIGWAVSSDSGKEELRLVAKYPLIEYLRLDEEEIISNLLGGCDNWNTHYLWRDNIKFSHRRNGYEFILTRDYAMMMQDICRASRASNFAFWNNVRAKAAA